MSIFKNGILIVAHPDDESLFFSSILSEISTIIFCFGQIPGEEIISNGRKKAVDEFPFKDVNIINLNIPQSKSSKKPLSWLSLKDNKYGVEGGYNHINYKNNYITLKKKLNKLITSESNVITHNPWGEYGNSEHIQVFKIIFNIAKEKNIKMLVSSYFSNLSISYAKRKQHFLKSESYFMETNQNLHTVLKKNYLKNRCWTWFNEYKLPLNETFYKIDLSKDVNSNSSNRNLNFLFNYIEFRNPISQYIRDVLKQIIPDFLKNLYRQKR